jgi:3-hydroxy-9,10-secoandrosta-1,3,5(10)-triene-9,17-dione monooxygenase reductase component
MAGMQIEPDQFRHVLGHLPTGVTVITANTTDGPVGLSANSVTSVSLEPPLILVCPAKTSETWPAIREAGRFCVNVMARHHEPTVRRFAVRGIDRFEGTTHHDRGFGPALDDAIAWIDCELLHEHEAGDHTIAVCSVLALEPADEGEPLVFYRGLYGTFCQYE